MHHRFSRNVKGPALRWSFIWHCMEAEKNPSRYSASYVLNIDMTRNTSFFKKNQKKTRQFQSLGFILKGVNRGRKHLSYRDGKLELRGISNLLITSQAGETHDRRYRNKYYVPTIEVANSIVFLFHPQRKHSILFFF